MKVQYFYRKDTHQIDAVYIECMTNSKKFKDANVYAEVNVVNPSYKITRDHKVILGSNGAVIGTEVNLNPLQPTPKPPTRDLLKEIDELKEEIRKLKKKTGVV